MKAGSLDSLESKKRCIFDKVSESNEIILYQDTAFGYNTLPMINAQDILMYITKNIRMLAQPDS